MINTYVKSRTEIEIDAPDVPAGQSLVSAYVDVEGTYIYNGSTECGNPGICDISNNLNGYANIPNHTLGRVWFNDGQCGNEENCISQFGYKDIVMIPSSEGWRFNYPNFSPSNLFTEIGSTPFITAFSLVMLVSLLIWLIWLLLDNRRFDRKIKRITEDNAYDWMEIKRRQDDLKRRGILDS